LAELRATRPDAEQKAQHREAALATARDRAEQAGLRERSARNALEAAFGALAAASEQHAKLAQRLATVSSRGVALGEAAERLAAEIADGEAALAQTAGDRAALPDLAAARAQLSDLRSELADRRSVLTERQSAVDRLARESETRHQRLSALEDEKASWERRAAEARRYLEALDRRQAEAQQELDTLASRPDELAARRDALAAQIERAETRRKAAADALAEGESRLAEADRVLKAEEQKLAGAREERVRSEAGLAQCEQALQALEQRVRERLDCALDGLLEQAEIDPGQDLPAFEEVESKLARLIRERDNMGPVNLLAEQEAAELDREITTMQSERSDLVSAIARLRQGISSLNREGHTSQSCSYACSAAAERTSS
jgi:chromosome segregation protein